MKLKLQISFFLSAVFLTAGLFFFTAKHRNNFKLHQNADSYSRIISLAPSITEILFSLELGDKIIGVSEFCNYPPQAKELPRVGGLLNPNFEAIVAAKPDLIIVFDDMPDAERKFASLRIETLTVKHDSLEEILDSIRTIGTRCNKARRAVEIVNAIENKIQKIQNAVKNKNKPKVLICLGHDYSQESSETPRNIYIAGNDGFYSRMVEYAGGINAYAGKLPFPAISGESVIAMNPQIIIDIAPASAKQADSQITAKQWQNFSQTDAAKNNRIYVFTEDYTAVPGPRFILTLEKIARIINPDYVTPVKTGVQKK